MKRLLDKINEGISAGYLPEEDILNGPKTRALPSKLRAYMARGCEAIHMNSMMPRMESYSIALS